MIDKNDPRLTDFVLGELNEADGAEIQDAIAKSPALEKAVQEIRQTVEFLGAAYQAETPLRLLDEQKAQLAQSRVNDVAVDLERAARGRPWLPIALAASLLGLLIGGAFYLQNQPLDPAVAKRIEEVGKLDKAQLDQLKAKSQANEGVENQELEKLVVDYNRSIDDGKYDDAERFAQRAEEIAPGSKIAVLMNEKAKLVTRLSMSESLQDAKESGFMPAEMSAESSDSESLADSDFADKIDLARNMDEEGATSGATGRSKMGRRSAEFIAGGEVAGSVDRLDVGKGANATARNGQPSSWNFQQQGSATDAFQKDAGGVAGRLGGVGGGGGGFVPQTVDEQQGRGVVRGRSRGAEFRSQNALHGENDYGVELEVKEAMEEDEPESLLSGGRVIQSFGGNGLGSAISGRDPMSRENAVPTDTPALAASKDRSLYSVPGSIAASDDNADPVVVPAPATPALSKQIEGKSEDFSKATAAFKSPAEPGQSKKTMEGASGDSPKRDGVAADDVVDNGIVGQLTGRKRLDELKKNQAHKFAEVEKEITELGLDKSLGLSLETGTKSVTESRNVPMQLSRLEERTREVKLKDGSTVQQKYEIEVPYSEEVAQERIVEVPYRYLRIKPEKSRQLVDKLARRYDPDEKREFGLMELFDSSIQELEESKLDESEGDELLIAKKLRDQMAQLGDKDKSGVDASQVLEQLNDALQKRNAKVRQTRTWKRVKAIPNTTRLMVGDKDELDLNGMQVNVQVDGFRARVLIDCFYYNDRGRQLEGNFKLRLPDDASLYYFAFGESTYDLQPKGQLAEEEFLDDGTQFVSLGAPEIRAARKDAWENVKEARMVPREKAAHAYRETVRRKVDPALVEWAGAGVFNARVFPLAPHKLHRIVIGYDVNLTKADGGWAYEFDLPEQPGQCRVDLNVQSIDGVQYTIEPTSDPVENVVADKTQRRYRFHGPQENGIRLTANQSPELLLCSDNEQEGEFWGIQMTPDLPVEEVAGNPQAIFLVDTSLSSNPDKFNVWLKMLESTLETNRDSLKQFNVLFFNVDAHFWQEKWVDNTQENVVELMEVCDTLALEGATDLYGAIETITASQWVKQAANPTSSPDLFLLSDGAANWGETNLRLIGRQMQDHHLGSLFAYQTGLTGTAISGLRFLAGQSGGAVFSVATEDEIKSASTAHRKRPWKLTSIEAEGATDIMTAGRVEWIYPGQSITLVGRGNIDKELKLELEQTGQTKTITVTPQRVESELASRLYGQIAVGQLESLGAKVFDVAASYARHFRVTGDSCSLLMLESEEDYKRFDIKPQEDLFVIKTKSANSLVAETLKKSASELADPKAQLVSWLERLESMPGMTYKMPTALKLAMDEIQVVAISQPLDCSLTPSQGLSKTYLDGIVGERLDYELIAAEADRRGRTSVDEAIKVFSSLVERNPGDLVIARDVAYTALELGRPAQAYHLLRNVAQARPFEGSVYPALGQCLAQLGQADMAIVYYEVALEGTFNRTGEDFKKIVSAEYMHLLRQIVAGNLESSVNDFAKARLATLTRDLNFKSAKLLITMMWNTDQTDVDLHVFEPSGEECSYENKTTRTGGSITSDITTGFGPEMYVNPDAPSGKYDVKVKFFASDQNRTELRNKVHLTIYRGFGTSDERVTRETIQLKKVGEKESVATVGVEK